MNACGKTYTIREISEMFSLPSSTLRYYEELGLLTDVGRTQNRQRIYTQAHIDRLHAVMCFKRTGLPIAKIADFFEYEKELPAHIDDILQLMTEHEKNTLRQLQELTCDLEHIRKKVRYYTALRESFRSGAPCPDYESI